MANIIIHPEAIERLIERSWEFAYKSYWHKFELSESRAFGLRLLISKYYEAIPARQFTELANVRYQQFINRFKQVEEADNLIQVGSKNLYGSSSALLVLGYAAHQKHKNFECSSECKMRKAP